jgi:hypothetical protein
LRRKNLVEAILLTRWLRPEAWLITTGGASSSDENAYAQALHQAAQQNQRRVKVSILALALSTDQAISPPKQARSINIGMNRFLIFAAA